MNNIETKQVRVNVTELKVGDVFLGTGHRVVVPVVNDPAYRKVLVTLTTGPYPRCRFSQQYKRNTFLTVERGILA